MLVVEKGLVLEFFTNASGTRAVNKMEVGNGGGDANKPRVAFLF